MKNKTVNSTKHNIVKFFAVLLVFYVVLPVSHATAQSFSSVEVGQIIDYTCPAGSAGGNWFVWGNDPGNFSGEGEWLCDDKSEVFTDGVIVVQETATTWSVNQTGSYTLESYDAGGTVTLESFTFDVVPATGGGGGGGGSTPLTITLVSTSSSFLDKVSTPLIASVQETGASIWPLFVFVGVSLAFVIALQMIVFTKRAVGVNKRTLEGTGRSRRRKNAYDDPMHPDHVAFERGKRANKDDGINLFPD